MSIKDKDLRPEYPEDLIRAGARGKYAARYREQAAGSVRIDPDLRKLFPDSEAVNRALRAYAEQRKLLQR
jgi:hypothetical protein